LDGSLLPILFPQNNIGLNIAADTGSVRGLVINRFTSAGMFLNGDNNIVQGNFVGTDVTGTLDRGNGAGVTIIAGSGNLVGGTTASERNLISGNTIGLNLDGTLNVIQGNYIGTDISGTLALGGIIGIAVSQENANNNMIGGISAGAGNLIAFNQVGIGLEQTVGDPFGDFSTGVGILGNRIHSNEGPIPAAQWLGIDLGPSSQQGVTPNDPGDADVGPNNLQNFPVLTGVVRSVGNTTISGTLNSIANQTYRLEFFSNSACDPSGHGEGETFLGAATTTTNGSGNATFTVNLPILIPPIAYVTSTATDPGNNTSEFSACLQASGVSADVSVNQTDAPDPVVVANNVVYTVIVANNGPEPATGIIVTDTLPANTSFISATPVQGSCLQNAGIVTCNLGALNPATSTSVTVIVQPTMPAAIVNQVTVSANEADLNASNNTSSINTSVVPPPVTATPSATPTQLPAPPAFTPLPTLIPSDVPPATDVPPPSETPTPTNTAFLLPSATATNTPLPPPPPLNP
jgi:uncharacterized repeat protein (TIGR01451 family)